MENNINAITKWMNVESMCKYFFHCTDFFTCYNVVLVSLCTSVHTTLISIQNKR